MIICADARRIPLADESVQCVVTSPPYWGLRKYAGEQDLIWPSGDRAIGSLQCAHEWATEELVAEMRVKPQDFNARWSGVETRKARGVPSFSVQRGTCLSCGAWRGAYGLEPTVQMYVAHTVEILRECRRVLRKDGVLFWNIGDSYAGSGQGAGSDKYGTKQRTNKGTLGWAANEPPTLRIRNLKPDTCNLKPKDLCLIPMRVALAAQGFAVVSAQEIMRMADVLGAARAAQDWDTVGMVESILRTWASWAALDAHWVRSVIIWAKPNPMPESVTDRPTDAYEHILMLTKSARYFWDAEAVKEPSCDPEASAARYKYAFAGANPLKHSQMPLGRDSISPEGERNFDGGRNLRNVWTFPTQPYSGAHFATFPEELPRRCITAATSERGACRFCGAPWERVTNQKAEIRSQNEESGKGSKFDAGKTAEHQGQRMQVRSLPSGDVKYKEMGERNAGARLALNREILRASTGKHDDYFPHSSTTGWRPTCECWEISCAKRCVVIGSNDHAKPITTGISLLPREIRDSKELLAMRRRLFRTDAGEQMVLTNMQGKMGGEAPKNDDGPDGYIEGVCDAVPAVPSESQERRICDGASDCDGENPGPLFVGERSRAPHQREEGGQPARESRIDVEVAARQDSETTAATSREGVPALWQENIRLGTCPHCGGEVVLSAPEAIPQLVLDPFGGSGTTGRVATELNRRAALLDLAYNHAYRPLAERRTRNVQRNLVFNAAVEGSTRE